ncbi:MAG: hypothetical protein EB059_00965 [Alphaproteobacteria bacterium]|nr:hypothetical protein [Alphaproteobacteria bacterium]
MSNFLDKFKGRPAAPAKSALSVYSVGPIARPLPQRSPAANAALPRAAAIYGAAAAVFAVLTVFYLIKGIWFTGLVMIIPTICLGGFAYYNLKE